MALLPSVFDPIFLLDFGQALVMRRTRLRAAENASRSEILAIQRRRLAHLLKHAGRCSLFYQRRWRGRIPSPEELPELEPVDKSLVLRDHFDEAVAAPDLNLDAARARLADMPQRQRGRYILVATSGTTGEPAVIPFARQEWREGMAYILRSADLASEGRRRSTSILRAFAERPRVAGVSTLNPIHVSSQLAASFHTGLIPTLRLPASLSFDEQVERLNRFQPTVLGGYPSALDVLTEAALDGLLAIWPRLVFSGGETVTTRLRWRVHEAWGVELFDFYGLAETLIIAGECSEHEGLHLYEDAVVLEVVDENGRVLPPGERGAGVLVTSLINRTLPIIRYAVSDLVTLSDEPCPCGLPFRRIVAIEGRCEELITLRKLDGKMVSVHPFVIESPLEEIYEVRRFQISEDGEGGVQIVIVPSGDEGGLSARVTEAVADALRPLGVRSDRVHVETAKAIESKRGPTDKFIRQHID
jgi:phenylacetate-coenzyme A ligase PaaK-like adenylate-forming protein